MDGFYYMIDLEKNKYDEVTLKKNIYAVSLLSILKTQTISEDFALTYILNKKFQLTEEERDITVYDVITYQPHLNLSSLTEKNNNDVRREDSVDDFQSYMEKN